jgi:3-oxoadipate enol-lactonase
MGYARLNGIDTYYEVSGSGPRLLFLNGSGATLAEANFLIEPIAERFEVAAMDPRGLGRTGPAPNPYSVSDLATDASALVDHLGWEHFRLMGLSFGGMVAQELAVTDLQRVDGLALLCTSAGGTGGSSFPLETLTNMDPAERDLLYPRLLDTRFTPDWLADHDSDRALIDLVLARLSAQQPDHVRKGAENAAPSPIGPRCLRSFARGSMPITRGSGSVRRNFATGQQHRHRRADAARRTATVRRWSFVPDSGSDGRSGDLAVPRDNQPNLVNLGGKDAHESRLVEHH